MAIKSVQTFDKIRFWKVSCMLLSKDPVDTRPKLNVPRQHMNALCSFNLRCVFTKECPNDTLISRFI